MRWGEEEETSTSRWAAGPHRNVGRGALASLLLALASSSLRFLLGILGAARAPHPSELGWQGPGRWGEEQLFTSI